MMGESLYCARMLNVSPESSTDAQTEFVESTYDAFGFVRRLRDRRGGERGRIQCLCAFWVVWSTVEVTADYCDVSYLNGVYTLSGINSDVIVQITGEVVTSDNPNVPSDDSGTDYTLYAILLIILAVICIALAVYIMRSRGSRV